MLIATRDAKEYSVRGAASTGGTATRRSSRARENGVEGAAAGFAVFEKDVAVRGLQGGA